MLIQVNPHKIVLIKTNDVNSGEYNVNECTFEFSQEFDNLTCIAVFSLCDGTTKNITILNNRCIIPTEVLTQTGQVKIGVYGYSVQDDELVLRYSPAPQIFVVTEGSYKEGTEPVAPTPTDWEILVEQVSDNSRDISNIKEDITGINGEISGINIDIRDLQDTKANINDLSAVAFSGSYNDLINKPNLSVYATKTDLSDEATLRENADVSLQEQIDAISVSSDVVDVVGTYQELLNYDTQHLKDNDIVKVLQDSTHSDALSYYRWDKEPQTWSYIGSEGPFYTKAETQELLNAKEDKITTTNKLDADLVDDSNSTNKFVTEEDITYWDNKEDKSNKVTEINSSSTDTQYPSAKCVYDSQEEQNEHIAELEMLYNAFPTVSDEDTTIQLDNTAKVKFREIDLKGNTSQVVIPAESGTNVNATSISISDVNTSKEHYFELDGNTYQETTTGKNLANFIDSKVYNYNNGVPSTISQASVISNKTNNSYNIKYGTNSFLGVVSNTMEFEENTDYVFSFNRPYNSNFTQRIHILQVNNDDSYTLLQAINAGVYGTPYTYTYSNTTAKKVAFMISTNNSNPKDETETISEIMVRKSTTSDTYEPYTYGASPNPSYPQNIEVVTGENDITICGKNLFDGEVEQGNYNTTTGEKILGNNLRSVNYIPITPNTTIKFSINGVGKAVNILEYKEDYTYIKYTNVALNSYITTTSETKYLTIYRGSGDGGDFWQLEKGSTATTYEQYQETTYPVNLGNIELCKIGDYQDRIYKQNDKWYLEKNIEKVVLDGSESENWSLSQTNTNTIRFLSSSALVNGLDTNNMKIICNKFSNGTSTGDNSDNEHIRSASLGYPTRLSLNINKSRLSTQDLAGFKTWLSNNQVTVYYVLATPTTTEITDSTLVNQLNALYNATIYPITNINTDTSNLLPYIDLQYNVVTPAPSPSRPSVVNVVKGNNTITISNSDNTESQNYPINLGNMELCKINTYQDYIYESNGNWFKKGNIGKVTLNGSESFSTQSSTTTNHPRFKLFVSSYNILLPSSNSNAFNGLCDYFNVISTSETYNSIQGVSLDTTYNLAFYVNDITTLEEFKTWLSTHNVTVYYTLETPITTEITDTTLITQLNNIKKAYSYDTQTNISQTNTDKPFIIYAEAIRSLKDVFE